MKFLKLAVMIISLLMKISEFEILGQVDDDTGKSVSTKPSSEVVPSKSSSAAPETNDVNENFSGSTIEAFPSSKVKLDTTTEKPNAILTTSLPETMVNKKKRIINASESSSDKKGKLATIKEKPNAALTTSSTETMVNKTKFIINASESSSADQVKLDMITEKSNAILSTSSPETMVNKTQRIVNATETIRKVHKSTMFNGKGSKSQTKTTNSGDKNVSNGTPSEVVPSESSSDAPETTEESTTDSALSSMVELANAIQTIKKVHKSTMFNGKGSKSQTKTTNSGDKTASEIVPSESSSAAPETNDVNENNKTQRIVNATETIKKVHKSTMFNGKGSKSQTKTTNSGEKQKASLWILGNFFVMHLISFKLLVAE